MDAPDDALPIDLAAFRVSPRGGVRKLAERLGVTPQAVYKWRKTGIPAERVLDVERESGVSRHELRPDIYPQDEVARAAG